MMGKFSRDKGNRTERGVVNTLQESGFAAERVPLSGAAGGKFKGDITLPLLGQDRLVEVKCQARGFKKIYGWLAGVEFLVLKADNKEQLVVLRLRQAIEIAKIAEGRRNDPNGAVV